MADRSYKLTLSLSDGSTINAGTITAPQGPNGANGTNGATFTPSVSAAGVLSWTNNGGLTNPPPISIKGPKGDDAVITASDVENWGFTKNKGTVTSVAVKINGTIKGTVTSSGTIDLGTVLTEHQDISGKANLLGGNTFTGKQTLNSPGSDGYSIDASGYIKGSWLQASAIANKGANTGKVCVFDNSGWIYYRTPSEILAEAGGAKASDIPTNYVNTDTAQDITCEKSFYRTPKFKDSIQIGDSNRIYGASDSPVVDQFLPAKDGTFAMISDIPDDTKHGYTQLTNENLNTITEAGWYNAASGNSCTNRPTNVGTSPFILEVEKCTSAEIRQTLYTRYWTNGFYIRTSTNSGSSWTSWQSQYTVDTGAQAFSGRKSFTGGINLNSSLQVNSSSGTAGQVLTSTGTGTPQWKTPSGGGDSVASVVDLTGYLIGGDSYYVFNNGEEGSFTGMIYCEYNTSAGDFEFQINDQIFSCTPEAQDITLRVTIDRFYNGYVYSYYYTIISNDGLINNSGFFTDTNRDMYISTSMGSSYAQGGVGTIIKKVL